MNSNDPVLPLDRILCGDCVEILTSLPENSIDVVFADPPYNLQLSKVLFRPNHTKVNAVTDKWDQFSSFDEYDRFTASWLDACRRVLKRNGALWVIGTYHNIYRLGKLLQDQGFWILNDIVWIKNNPMPNFRGVRFTNAHETLIWAQKTRNASYTFNHQSLKSLNDDLQMRSDWYLPIVSGSERLKNNGTKSHSTQKPEALLYRVILATTNPGDIILDPFSGTGTTAVVAKKLGRHWIGIDQNPEYVEIANKRLKETIPVDPGSLTLATRKKVRIPFGKLLEQGLLSPGQALYFARNGPAAKILSDGRLQCGDLHGSIHQIASAILGAPANGWELWLYEDKEGNKRTIDTLRIQIHQQMEL